MSTKKLQIIGSISGGSNVEIDTTLAQEGKAADAKAVGDALGLKLDSSELPTAIDTALAQAKESGEFDGTDGHTPVRGTDYWTDEDKAEIKAYVDEAILGGAW